MAHSKKSPQAGKGEEVRDRDGKRRAEGARAPGAERGFTSEPRSVPGPRDRTWRFGTRETAERELYLLAQHLAGFQIQELAVLLRPHGITPEQYHVLRVLEEAGPVGLACSAVAERSVSGDPDVTRLLDRLEKQGWVTRSREPADRRVVTARISSEGRRMLARLDGPVAALHAGQFAGLGESERRTLHRLLLRVARGA
jgi:DNA-binding MarR family transcriptional regulator